MTTRERSASAAAAVSLAGPLRRLLRVMDALAGGMAMLAGLAFLLTAFYIAADVIGRRFFGFSTAVTDEMGGYALAFGAMWALADTLRTGGHVRIDVVLPLLPGRLRVVLNYAAAAVMAFFAAVLAIYVWHLALESYVLDARAMSFLRTPLLIPQALMAFGLTVLAVHAAVIFKVGVAESVAAGRLIDPPLTAGAFEGHGAAFPNGSLSKAPGNLLRRGKGSSGSGRT